MSRKALLLAVIALLFSVPQVQAKVINSRWAGGEYGLWADASNWDPYRVPDNDGYTFVVTMDSDGVGVGHVAVGLQQNRTVDQLDCYGQVELFNGTSDWVDLALINPNGLTNYGELEIEGERRMEINGNVTNTAGAELELWGTILIGSGDLHNSTGATIKVGGDDIGVDTGSVENRGTIVIDPETEFWADQGFYNDGQIRIYGGQCQAGVFDNNSTGIISGFGYVEADASLRNKGAIYASGGILPVICGGSVTNTGILGNKALSSLHIKPAEDVVNNGMIEVNAGGGVAFDCNLVNESGGTIRLLGGTLAAQTITESAAATFEGFGGIIGDVLIDPNGIIKLTGPTNIVGDVTIEQSGVLEISDGQTLITGHTTNNGVIRVVNGDVVFQGGYSGDGVVQKN